MNNKKTIYVVVGPTASGKTKFAVKLAKKINAEIISLDSMQIYKYLNIGTAKIKNSEMEGIKHYMIDVIDPDQNFSVSEYKKMVEEIIDDIFSRNKNVIMCGGTGLYLEALIYNYTFSSYNKNDKFRKDLEDLSKEKGTDFIYNMLLELDEESAKNIHKNNIKRIIRAIEIATFSRDKKTNLKDEKKLKYNINGYFLNLERNKLYEKINKRVDLMFENGLMNEIEYILNSLKLNFSMQSMSAIGYKEFNNYKNKNINDIKEEIKKNTRHYAKRQITWFKRYDFLKEININKDEELEKILRGL